MTVLQKLPKLAFNAGELASPRRGRIDMAKYAMALEYCIGFIPRVAGEAERAPGFRFVAAAKDHDNAPRLLPVIYNDVQAYIVELGETYARFFMLGGQIKTVSPDAIYEIATPWAQADVARLQTAQRSDTTFVAGGARGYAPQLLQRLKHADWTIGDWQSDTGPFLDPNDSAVTITPSGVTGTITLTASADTFDDPGHVGALWRIGEDDTNGYSMWEPAKSYTGGTDVVRYGVNVYAASHSGAKTSGIVPPVHLTGKRHDGIAGTACQWTYLHSGFGVARITAVASATSATATVLSRLPSTSAVTNWREGAFSDYRGWPVAVAFAGQRLWWGGTKHRPRTLWGSVAGDPFDFTPGALADDAVTLTLESIESRPIRTLGEDGNALYVGTGRRIYRVTGAENGPIRPDSIWARKIAGVGASGVQPIDAGRSLLIVDQTGVRLQEIAYDVAADDEAARDLTRLADHILRPGG